MPSIFTREQITGALKNVKPDTSTSNEAEDSIDDVSGFLEEPNAIEDKVIDGLQDKDDDGTEDEETNNLIGNKSIHAKIDNSEANKANEEVNEDKKNSNVKGGEEDGKENCESETNGSNDRKVDDAKDQDTKGDDPIGKDVDGAEGKDNKANGSTDKEDSPEKEADPMPRPTQKCVTTPRQKQTPSDLSDSEGDCTESDSNSNSSRGKKGKRRNKRKKPEARKLTLVYDVETVSPRPKRTRVVPPRKRQPLDLSGSEDVSLKKGKTTRNRTKSVYASKNKEARTGNLDSQIKKETSSDNSDAEDSIDSNLGSILSSEEDVSDDEKKRKAKPVKGDSKKVGKSRSKRGAGAYPWEKQDSQGVVSVYSDGKKSDNSPKHAEQIWNVRIEQLRQFKEKYGHCYVPNTWEEQPGLARWLRRKKIEYRKKVRGERYFIKDYQIDAFVELGVDFDSHKKPRKGSSDSEESAESDAGSKSSTGKKRKKKKRKKRDAQQLEVWKQRIQELKDFKNTHGHCNVPVVCEELPALSRWLRRKKKDYKRKQNGEKYNIKDHEIESLIEVGVDLDNQREKLPFEERFSQLQQYKEDHGDCNVKRSYTKAPGLGCWVAYMRASYRNFKAGRKTHISEQQFRDLDNIGFAWSLTGEQSPWEERFQELCAYKKEFGDTLVPARFRANFKLGQWVAKARADYQKKMKGRYSSLNDDRIARLEAIGFSWFEEQKKTNWEKKFYELRHYKAEFGDCLVPYDFQRNPRLGKWVQDQRESYYAMKEGRESSMTLDHAMRLGELGFSWTGEVDPFRAAASAHAPVPSYRIKKSLVKTSNDILYNPPIKTEATSQSSVSNLKYTENGREILQDDLSANKTNEELLQQVNIGESSLNSGNQPEQGKDPRPIEDDTTDNGSNSQSAEETPRRQNDSSASSTQISQEPSKREGTTIPVYFDDSGKEKRKEKPPARKSQKLSWDQRIEQLKEFKNIHGHCNVPVVCKELPGLSRWLRTKKMDYRRKKNGEKHNIKDQEIEAMIEVGVDFDNQREKLPFEERFKQLQQYKEEHGNCNVKRSYTKAPGLGCWVAYMRASYRNFKAGRKTHISKQQFRDLDYIGFSWSLTGEQSPWEERFQELCAYKKEFGDTLVPYRFRANIKLGQWVAKVRAEYQKRMKGRYSSLNDDRIARLEAIGFSWFEEQKKTNWEKKFYELRHYKAEFGDCLVPYDFQRNPRLGKWVQDQRESYYAMKQGRESSMTLDHAMRLGALGFAWLEDSQKPNENNVSFPSVFTENSQVNMTDQNLVDKMEGGNLGQIEHSFVNQMELSHAGQMIDHTQVNQADHTHVNQMDHTQINQMDHNQMNQTEHNEVNQSDHNQVNQSDHNQVNRMNQNQVNHFGHDQVSQTDHNQINQVNHSQVSHIVHDQVSQIEHTQPNQFGQDQFHQLAHGQVNQLSHGQMLVHNQINQLAHNQVNHSIGNNNQFGGPIPLPTAQLDFQWGTDVSAGQSAPSPFAYPYPQNNQMNHNGRII